MKRFLLLIVLVMVLATACGEPPEPTLSDDGFQEITVKEIEVKEINVVEWGDNTTYFK